MSQDTSRRRFLKQGAALAAACTLSPSLSGIEPLGRSPSGRFKLSCAAYSFDRYLNLKKPSMTLEQFIEKCAGWGTDGIELTEYYFEKPVTPQYVMRLKRAAVLWGQDITGTPIGNNFALPPGDERDKQVASVKNWIDVSADIGSPAIRIFAGGAPKGIEDSVARKWVVESIDACCEHAARRGVFLALENHGGVVATAEGLLDIVKAVRCDWVGINLDTGNFHTADPYGDFARCVPYSLTCQLKTEITPAGGKKENADLARIVEILRKGGYRGHVTLEYEAAEEPMEAVPRHLAALRKLLG